MFKTEEEVLLHFMDEGCMLDTENGVAYISDIGGGGSTFYGIMVAEGLPDDVLGDLTEACQYALGCIPAPGTGAPNRMEFMEAPGWWFGEFAEQVIAHPERFLA